MDNTLNVLYFFRGILQFSRQLKSAWTSNNCYVVSVFPNFVPSSLLTLLSLLLCHVPNLFTCCHTSFLTFLSLQSAFSSAFTLPSSLTLFAGTYIYALFHFLLLFGLPFPHLYLTFCCLLFFLLFSSVSSPRQKPVVPPWWLFPISKNWVNCTAALLEKGGVSRAMVRPVIGCHSHIHATWNVAQSSCIGKRHLL